MKLEIVTILNNIDKLCKSKNITVAEMLRECGLNKSTVNSMKNGSLPTTDKLMAISNYFGVSLDYLLGNNPPKAEPIAPDVEAMLAAFGSLSEENKKKVLEYAELIKNSQK